jgi:hypothetical protein
MFSLKNKSDGKAQSSELKINKSARRNLTDVGMYLHTWKTSSVYKIGTPIVIYKLFNIDL